MKHQAQSACLLGTANRLLHLAQDLRLAEHHGVQPAGHAKRMLDRVLGWKGVDERLQARRLHMVIAGEPAHRSAGLLRAAIHFRAVAGGNDGCFAHGLLVDQIAQRHRHAVGIERDAFPHLERRGLMINAESEQLHRLSLSGALAGAIL